MYNNNSFNQNNFRSNQIKIRNPFLNSANINSKWSNQVKQTSKHIQKQNPSQKSCLTPITDIKEATVENKSAALLTHKIRITDSEQAPDHSVKSNQSTYILNLFKGFRFLTYLNPLAYFKYPKFTTSSTPDPASPMKGIASPKLADLHWNQSHEGVQAKRRHNYHIAIMQLQDSDAEQQAFQNLHHDQFLEDMCDVIQQQGWRDNKHFSLKTSSATAVQKDSDMQTEVNNDQNQTQQQVCRKEKEEAKLSARNVHLIDMTPTRSQLKFNKGNTDRSQLNNQEVTANFQNKRFSNFVTEKEEINPENKLTTASIIEDHFINPKPVRESVSKITSNLPFKNEQESISLNHFTTNKTANFQGKNETHNGFSEISKIETRKVKDSTSDMRLFDKFEKKSDPSVNGNGKPQDMTFNLDSNPREEPKSKSNANLDLKNKTKAKKVDENKDPFAMECGYATNAGTEDDDEEIEENEGEGVKKDEVVKGENKNGSLFATVNGVNATTNSLFANANVNANSLFANANANPINSTTSILFNNNQKLENNSNNLLNNKNDTKVPKEKKVQNKDPFAMDCGLASNAGSEEEDDEDDEENTQKNKDGIKTNSLFSNANATTTNSLFTNNNPSVNNLMNIVNNDGNNTDPFNNTNINKNVNNVKSLMGVAASNSLFDSGNNNSTNVNPFTKNVDVSKQIGNNNNQNANNNLGKLFSSSGALPNTNSNGVNQNNGFIPSNPMQSTIKNKDNEITNQNNKPSTLFGDKSNLFNASNPGKIPSQQVNNPSTLFPSGNVNNNNNLFTNSGNNTLVNNTTVNTNNNTHQNTVSNSPIKMGNNNFNPNNNVPTTNFNNNNPYANNNNNNSLFGQNVTNNNGNMFSNVNGVSKQEVNDNQGSGNQLTKSNFLQPTNNFNQGNSFNQANNFPPNNQFNPMNNFNNQNQFNNMQNNNNNNNFNQNQNHNQFSNNDPFNNQNQFNNMQNNQLGNNAIPNNNMIGNNQNPYANQLQPNNFNNSNNQGNNMFLNTTNKSTFSMGKKR